MSQVKPAQSYIDESRAASLLEKWNPVLDYNSTNVKAIDDDHTRLNTAILLENQEAWCLNEANLASDGGVFGANLQGTPGQGGAMTPAGDFYAKGDARLPKILIPMIRRTFPELITNEIVGVQPMSGPVGLAFALRYKYSAEALGTGIDGKTGPVTSDGSGGTQGHANGGVLGASNDSDGKEIGYQFLDSRYTGTSSPGLSGSTDATDGVAGGEDFKMLATDSGVAALLANYELTGNIPQMEISFEKTAVEAGTRRLAARWSVELEQDLKNMNGIDVDTELTNAMSYEIQAEIDREMIMRMVQVALTAGAKKGYSSWNPKTADGRWLAERNRDLYAKIIVEANRIAVRNRRGAANFVVATPKVCAILEMLPEFQWMQVQGNVNTQPVGIARVGNLGGRFNVYRDTRTEAQNPDFQADSGATGKTAQGKYAHDARSTELNYVLLGYKGPEFYDTGIIYCPYIPVMVQRTIGPNDFAPRVGLLTRYGVVDNIFGADLYYHLILIKDLGTSFVPGSASVYF
tara:strand:+ start:792 stop:2345 length:1554 start_codon:yes stop_codon:yes gene_type:complete